MREPVGVGVGVDVCCAGGVGVEVPVPEGAVYGADSTRTVKFAILLDTAALSIGVAVNVTPLPAASS